MNHCNFIAVSTSSDVDCSKLKIVCSNSICFPVLYSKVFYHVPQFVFTDSGVRGRFGSAWIIPRGFPKKIVTPSANLITSGKEDRTETATICNKLATETVCNNWKTSCLISFFSVFPRKDYLPIKGRNVVQQKIFKFFQFTNFDVIVCRCKS